MFLANTHVKNTIPYFLGCIFILLFVFACKEETAPINAETLHGYWLGGALKIDEDNFRPINQLMDISQNEVGYLLPIRGESNFPFSIENDTIKFGSIERSKREFKRHGNTLEIGKFHPNLYLKLEPVTLDLAVSEISELLISRVWKSKDAFLDFEQDSLIVFDMNSGKKQKMCWDVMDYKGAKYLIREGSFADCNYPSHGIWHITHIGEGRLEVIGWTNNKFERKIYLSENNAPEGFNYSAFQLCNPYISRILSMDSYSFKYTHFEGGLYRLRNIFDKSFKIVTSGANTGIIKIGFIVNCEGDIGAFEIEEMDLDYNLTTLNKEIQNQIIAILKSAGKWIPGQRNDLVVDTYKFLSFRIKDGRIIEIFP